MPFAKRGTPYSQCCHTILHRSWMGRRKLYAYGGPCEVLYDRQIDFDIVSTDILLSDASVEDKKLIKWRELWMLYSAIFSDSFYKKNSHLINISWRHLQDSRYAGTSICSPYLIDVTDVIRQGENLLEIEVANTLAYKRKAIFRPLWRYHPRAL